MSDRSRLLALLRQLAFRRGHFVLSSGRESAYFVDTKRVALHPEGATLCGRLLRQLQRERWPSAQAIGGETLGADPLAVSMAIASADEESAVHAFVVRKVIKDHGTKHRIEASGAMPEGARVVVLDDVVTTGGAALRAVAAAREAGHDVLGLLALVDRGEGGREAIEAEGLDFAALFHLDEIADDA